MRQDKAVRLILADGHEFRGRSFGFEKPVSGEVVFNTAMMGYPESLTDPSYSGQILVMTYPLVGNYGVPDASFDANGISVFYESEKIHVRALVVSDYSWEYSHWNAQRSLSDWLKAEGVVGIYGIDTRELTKVLREHGVLLGRVVFEDEEASAAGASADTAGTPADAAAFDDPNLVNQVALVSCQEKITYGHGRKRVCLVDCGVKHNILRCLLQYDVTVTRVPWDYDFNADGPDAYDGLFISNGPGDPNFCGVTVEHIRTFMQTGKPIYGICMGNQLLSLAAGARVSKLKYGHRGHNQPVRRVGTDQCFITSQNHGFAVENDTIPAGWEPLFVNMNDGTNEGIRSTEHPWFSAQFHPEASSGPTDTEFIFGEFFNLL